MRHYEIVYLVHPDQSEQVTAMADRYKGVIEQGGEDFPVDVIERSNHWVSRSMAVEYSVKAQKHRTIYCLVQQRRSLQKHFLRRLVYVELRFRWICRCQLVAQSGNGVWM